MEKWDLSERQFWVVIWGLVFTVIVIIAGIINSNSNNSRNSEISMRMQMINKGYIQVEKKTCISYSNALVWEKTHIIDDIAKD